METMTKKLFEKLADYHQPWCVSIYIPTSRIGLNEESRIRLKNQMQLIKKSLAERGLKEPQIKELLQPLNKIYDDRTFWRHLSDGLAIFFNKNHFESFTLPLNFKEFSDVNDSFYLLPLIPYFFGDGRFLILAVSLKNTKLYEASRTKINEIDIKKRIPISLEDAVGYDFEQRHLQFRSEQRSGQAVFHGQGDTKDEKKEEVVKYLREIDRGLLPLFNEYNVPLIIASFDYIFIQYKQINSYNGLYEKNASMNPDENDIKSVHEKSWNVIKEYFQENEEQAKEQYYMLSNKKRTSSRIEEIVPAAIDGNIDTLFVQAGKNVWGLFLENYKTVIVNHEKHNENRCLIDLAAKASFLQGGKVFIMKEDELPEKETVANAILRY